MTLLAERTNQTELLTDPESTALKQEQVLGLSEDAPVVSMDRELGKKYGYVEFDYEAFGEEAERLGLSPQRASELSITINAKSGLDSDLGRYQPSKKLVMTTAGKHSNKVLSHELQHAADDEAGILGSTPSLGYRVGILAGRLMPLTVPLNIANAAAVVSGSELAERMHTPIFALTLLGGLASLGYWRNSSEVRARKAEKSSPQMITFHPR